MHRCIILVSEVCVSFIWLCVQLCVVSLNCGIDLGKRCGSVSIYVLCHRIVGWSWAALRRTICTTEVAVFLAGEAFGTAALRNSCAYAAFSVRNPWNSVTSWVTHLSGMAQLTVSSFFEHPTLALAGHSMRMNQSLCPSWWARWS